MPFPSPASEAALLGPIPTLHEPSYFLHILELCGTTEFAPRSSSKDLEPAYVCMAPGLTIQRQKLAWMAAASHCAGTRTQRLPASGACVASGGKAASFVHATTTIACTIPSQLLEVPEHIQCLPIWGGCRSVRRITTHHLRHCCHGAFLMRL